MAGLTPLGDWHPVPAVEAGHANRIFAGNRCLYPSCDARNRARVQPPFRVQVPFCRVTMSAENGGSPPAGCAAHTLQLAPNNVGTSHHEPLFHPGTRKRGPMHYPKARCLRSPLEGGSHAVAGGVCPPRRPNSRDRDIPGICGCIHPPALRAIRLRLEASAGQAPSKGGQ